MRTTHSRYMQCRAFWTIDCFGKVLPLLPLTVHASDPPLDVALPCACSDSCSLVCCLCGGLQWKLLHGLLENAIYGGRVDNTLDGRVSVLRAASVLLYFSVCT